MKRSLFFAAALLGGGVGFFLRYRQWLTAYDSANEILFSRAPATLALLALLGGLAVLFLILAFASAPAFASGKRPACPSTLYMMVMAVGAFLFLGAGVLALLRGMEQLQAWQVAPDSVVLSYPTSLLLCGGLCIPAMLGVLMTGKNAYRDEPSDKASLAAVLPPIALLVWLFATHLEHATDPIFLNYGLFLTAAVLLLLAHYDIAGFYQGHPHPRRFLFCSGLGTALVLTCLADGLSLLQLSMALASILPVLAQSAALLSNEKTASHFES